RQRRQGLLRGSSSGGEHGSLSGLRHSHRNRLRYLGVQSFGMQQRNVRAVIALGCAVALLLPILSIFDDDFFDRDAFDELAVIVPAFVITAALIALAMIEPSSRVFPRYGLVIHSAPRSPPRA